MGVVRHGTQEDIDAAVAVWRAAEIQRRGTQSIPNAHEDLVRAVIRRAEIFVVVAGERSEVVGVALGEPGREDDGAGPKVPGLWHISMIFVSPDRWGQGIGRSVVGSILQEARALGYDRAQLWTDVDNTRAQRLYEAFHFVRSGREKDGEFGGRITHYTCTL